MELTHIVQHEVEGYAGAMLKGKSYTVVNTQENVFAVVDVPDHFPRKFPVSIAVMARIVGDLVVIDEDTTDRPLVNELTRAGIPREQIVCTYIGESLPQET
ncbi:MAG: XisI protein [Anaerolineae bacterium]|nr:XisI protein [Anaerolineae bacterium]